MLIFWTNCILVIFEQIVRSIAHDFNRLWAIFDPYFKMLIFAINWFLAIFDQNDPNGWMGKTEEDWKGYKAIEIFTSTVFHSPCLWFITLNISLDMHSWLSLSPDFVIYKLLVLLRIRASNWKYLTKWTAWQAWHSPFKFFLIRPN